MSMHGQDNRSFWDHLEEFRWRLLWMIGTWILGVFIGFPFSIQFIRYASRHVGELIFLSPTEAFAIRFQTALLLGAVIAMPIWFYYIIQFIWEGLKPKEQKLLVWMGVGILGLMGIGAMFADFILIPVSVNFLLSFGGAGLHPMLTAQQYLAFYFSILFFCCFIFNLPFVIIGLSIIGVLDVFILERYRRHVCVVCFILSAIFTPPDAVTQILMALPLYVLYEVGIFGVKIFVKRVAIDE